MSPKNTYTAVAIGPVYKTMSQARRTRHLWGASYLFSFIMKQLIKKLLDNKAIAETDILLPYSTAALREGKEGHGTGLFPDRLIMETPDKEKLRIAILDAEAGIINDITAKAGNQHYGFFRNYFRIYTVQFTLPAPASMQFDEPSGNNNIVMVANRLLDSAELKEKYCSDISDIDWQTIIDALNGKDFLYKDAFGPVRSDYQFPYLLEIATADFRRANTDLHEKLVREIIKDETEGEQEIFLNTLEQKASEPVRPFGNLQIKAYHKYIAVVQADGDSIGATIGHIGNDKAMIQEFSKALSDFAIEATKAIKRFGGKPVYIGGDDLLFFAPVAMNNNENMVATIFDLIQRLDLLFEEKLVQHDKLKLLYNGKSPLTKPTLSYGVSVTFTKYPLNEARESAYELMKKAKEKKDDKNKICFKLHKHSGQGFGFTIDKKKYSGSISQPKSFDSFLALTANIPIGQSFLSPVIYKLHPIRALINEVAKDEKRLEALFDNTFNENTHKVPEVKNILDRVRSFIYQVYNDFENDGTDIPEYETVERSSNLQKVYSTLRFVKFVTDGINE